MANVLLLDDKPAERQGLRTLLERAGHRVVEAADAETGLTAFRSDAFDLVLLDLDLPRKGGSRVLVDLVTADPAVRVLVTARGPETISTRAYLDIAHDHGYVRALPKPFTPPHFLRAVSVMLGGDEWGAGSSEVPPGKVSADETAV